MKLNMYVIFDTAAQVYNKPVCLVNDQVALRSATDLVNSDSECARHPEHFIMFRIGEYEDTTAKITYLEEYETIARFIELKAQAKEIEQ